MDFHLTDVQLAWRDKARGLGEALPGAAAAADVVLGAAGAGLVDPRADLLSAAVAVEALAAASSAAGVVLAIHSAAVSHLGTDDRFTALVRGEIVGAVTMSTEEVPIAGDHELSGQASWVGPVTDRGLALVAGRRGSELVACAVSLDAPGCAVEPLPTAALAGVTFGRARFERVPCVTLGSPIPIMSRVRVLLAAAGLGMGRRALREALDAARDKRGTGAGGEQTVQGLLADAATELDAAMMLIWKAASASGPTLAEASMAKLAATEATQRAVARTTQVVGVESFTRGHVVERLAQDVRALELFAGRTEALREAVAGAILPTAN
jgi:alkylation response protein AidB-like acyl-CoA dehydrogenase